MRVAKSLGMAVPQRREIYELSASLRNKKGQLAELLRFLGNSNVHVLSSHSQASGNTKWAEVIMSVDLSEATEGVQNLMTKLKRSNLVLQANVKPTSETWLRDLFFPPASGSRARGVLMSAKTWVFLQKRLVDTFGSGGEFLLQQMGFEMGENIVEEVRQSLRKRAPKRELLDAIKNYLKSNGLCILSLEVDNEAKRLGIRRIRIKLDERISSSAEEIVEDWLLVGIVRGAVAKVYGGDYLVHNLKFSSSTVTFSLTESRTEE